MKEYKEQHRKEPTWRDIRKSLETYNRKGLLELTMILIPSVRITGCSLKACPASKGIV